MNLFFVSMGCAKNSVDSEHLIGLLARAGHKIVDGAKDARGVIINTCGFIQDAVKENIDAILDLELMKERGDIEKIIVTGCLVNRHELDLRKELPSVDLWAKAEEWDKILAFLNDDSSKTLSEAASNCAPRGMLPENKFWSRYLKVGEGCDTCCSYCTIPLLRGRLRSVPIPKLVDEAVQLSAQGAKELCLVGQDLTAYGRDIYGGGAIEKLLTSLGSALPDDIWIRLLYLHPDRVTRKFLDFLSEQKKVIPYLDIPIQHIDDDILCAMNRTKASRHIRDIVSYARASNSAFALRTTIMVGFPGETEEQFESVLDFLGEAKLDRVGAFVYSPEEGTKAAAMPQLSDGVKESRYRRLMEFQSAISASRNALFVGKLLRVLVEEIDEIDDSAWGRSYRDAPEVDGMVRIEKIAQGSCAPGSFIDVRITDAAEYDLFGVPV
ncbi:ribosomal protein S12 methylthiotransferase RimO [Synergistales bacterium]|nr:ribosomal protein S12 methylthiotransferase RimO [Synergistales bacterium]